MAEFIQNPRRSPRAPARCRTAVVSAHGTFEATTEDVGGHGCQLVSPRLVRKGEPIQLVVTHETMKDPLRVAGRVAWASDRAPWRLGIAYDEGQLPASQAWFEELLGRVPGLSAFKRIPDRIPLDAVIYLATPPRFLVDFTPDEVALLRSVGSGTSVAELRSLLRDRWQQAQRALFSLLAHQHVTLARGASVHPDAWRKILSEAESSLAVESLRGAPIPDLTPPPAPLHPAPPVAAPIPAARSGTGSRPLAPAAGAAARPGTGSWPVAPAAGAAARAGTGSWPLGTPPAARPPVPAAPAPRPAVPAAPAARPAVPAAPVPDLALPADPGSEVADWLVPAVDLMPQGMWPTPVGPQSRAPQAPAAPPRGFGRGIDEGVQWGTEPPPLTGGFALPTAPARSPEAQGCYERALAELEAGRLAGAMALLRRALALAPGDAEIAGALARVTERKRG